MGHFCQLTVGDFLCEGKYDFQTLMGLSFLFMSCNLYSDLWLGLQLNARAYATLDHTKYLGASVSSRSFSKKCNILFAYLGNSYRG